MKQALTKIIPVSKPIVECPKCQCSWWQSWIVMASSKETVECLHCGFEVELQDYKLLELAQEYVQKHTNDPGK